MKTNQSQKNTPNDWQIKTLGDFLEKLEGGGTPSKDNPDYWNGSIPWASVKDVVTHNPSDTQDHISELGLKNSSSRLVSKGTLIVPTRMALGHAVVFNVDVAINQDLKALYPKKTLLNQYLFHWFKSKKTFIERLGSGSTVSGIQQNELKRIKFDLPLLAEQSRIVSVLDTWDESIKKIEQTIQIKKQIKKGLMQNLLNGKKQLIGFNDKWKNFAFGDVAILRKERFDPKRDRTEKFCIELEHIESDTGRLIGSASLSENSSLKTVFYSGDVLFGKLRAYLRKYWCADRNGVCSTEIWALKADREKIIPEILFQIIQSERFISFATMSQGTHMPRSNWDIVSDQEVTLPPIKEQVAIAIILTTADKEITELEKKLSILKEQKRYLLNNLITGTIRTPETLSVKINA